MSRRKSFSLGDGCFLIEDEYAQETYVGMAKIGEPLVKVEIKRKPRRSELGNLLVTIGFSVGALILGFLVARVMR
jgi:hypothetical protein